MADAYKCDECHELHEGKPAAFEEVQLGDIEAVFGFGYKPEPNAPRRELNPIEQMMGISNEPQSRRAELCRPCMLKLARLALERIIETAPVA